MSKIDVDFDAPAGDVTPEHIKAVFATLAKLVAVGKVLANLTPNVVDDRVLETIDKTMKLLEPFAAEPWVADLVNVIVALFRRKDLDVKQRAERVIQALSELS